MDIFLLLFLVIIIISGIRGYRNGPLVIITRLISLIGAYLLALIFTRSLANWLQSETSIKGFMAYMAAGFMLFVCAGIVLSLISKLVLKSNKKIVEREDAKVFAGVGSLLGGVLGIFSGVFVVWFLLSVKSLWEVKNNVSPEEPSKFQRAIIKIADTAFKTSISATTGEPELASSGARFLSRPGENIQRVNRLLNARKFQNLIQSETIRNALRQNKVELLSESNEFIELVEHPDFMPLLGFNSSTEDKNKAKQLIAQKALNLWSQVQQVRNNPQYIEIINDPQTQEIIRSRNVLKLLNSQKIESLFKLISSVDTNQKPSNSKNSNETNPKSIHRWIDENGIVHYSDKKNTNGIKNKKDN